MSSERPYPNEGDEAWCQRQKADYLESVIEKKVIVNTSHEQCSASTGIHENLDANGKSIPWGLTFGFGELDQFSYWEFPCSFCARRAEKRDEVPTGSYWPWE